MRLKKLIVQNIFWRGLYFLSVFILNIIISRYFKASGSGWIYYVINNLSLLLLITSASLESGAAYYSSQNSMSREKIAGFCFLWAVAATVISAFFLLVLSKFILGNEALSHEYFISCVAYIFGFLLINYFSALFYAKQDFFISNFISLGFNIAAICFIIFFADTQFLNTHFVAVYFVSFLLQGLAIAIVYFLKSKKRQIGFLSLKEIKVIARYSLDCALRECCFFSCL